MITKALVAAAEEVSWAAAGSSRPRRQVAVDPRGAATWEEEKKTDERVRKRKRDVFPFKIWKPNPQSCWSLFIVHLKIIWIVTFKKVPIGVSVR